MSRTTAGTASLLFILLFTGCASMRQPGTYISNLGLNSRPTPAIFDVCDSAGCRSISGLGYTAEEWRGIASIFEPEPEHAAQERERITIAVGAMETIIGKKNGTLGDAPKNKRRLGTGKQLDCIAEAANTTVALMLLEQDGLLKFHRVGFPAHRGFIQLRYPHNAASVVQLDTGEKYVIDSWFFRGGEPAVSVPMAKWKSGYDPDNDPGFTAPDVR